MKNLSKLLFFCIVLLSTLTVFFTYKIDRISAGDEGAVPGIKFPCDETSDDEFHSLRPYQGAPCGDAGKALFCSNEIQFIETFDLSSQCPRNGRTGDYTCDVNYPVGPHNLYIELSESEFAILGNTEQVTNNYGGTEEFDDAQKLNEYASWYLSGVVGRAEYGTPTNEQVVNYSGPVNKLIPYMIQEHQRRKTITDASVNVAYEDEDIGATVSEPQNHDQIVVCEQDGNPIPCSQGGEPLRLSSWGEGSLSTLNWVLNLIPGIDKWNNKFPPLPWDFEKQIDYQKAYQEWQGKVCVVLPFLGLQCADPAIGGIIDIVPNKWSELYSYIPLSSTVDKKGANYIKGDGPNFEGGAGTEISFPNGIQFTGMRQAPLYFAHTQEVKDLSELLNTTFTPSGYEAEKLSETVESLPTNELGLSCSAANIRVNEGDNLFPGDQDEMQVLGVQYQIDQVLCKVTETFRCIPNVYPCVERLFYTHKCNAQVYITLKTGTKTPWADEIFAQTVADSGSTFRKIFPKVGEGAPVECIADIPTVTDVTYDTSRSDSPNGGDQEVKITNYPSDGANSTTQLTFPHIGSVYEYFLKGIQTALRPKGYGEPIANGNCEPTVLDSCDVTVPDSAVPSKYLGSFKENFIDLADRWSQKCPGPENNMAEECYNFVASVAQKEGVNPAFALTIWLNESGASNYCEGGETTQDMGVNLKEIYQNLPEQVLKFTQLAKQQFCSGMSGYTEPMHGWLSRYQSSAGICDPSDTVASQYYYDVMNTTWNWVTGCPKNGKFGIQWPTDFSCP
ncbi:MAG: hypothetical protein QY322_03160 [bacterium]|nr:MAG: hypothetical protein QY322_03160 [bacterium]